MAHEFNETKRHLVQATSDLMDEFSLEDISASMVLDRAGASKSSMYHFFEDFSELLEAAFLVKFATSVEASEKAISGILDISKSKEEFFYLLEKVTRKTQARANSAIRFQRARMLGRCERNERFQKSLGEIQQKLTDSLGAAIQSAQEKGFVTTRFSARTLAVFIQSYTLGKIVDDITATQMDDSDWESLISAIAREVISARDIP